MRWGLLLVAVGCVPKVPPPIFGEPPRQADVPPVREVAPLSPDACRGVVVKPGQVVTCTGIAISAQHADRDALIAADLVLLRTELERTEQGRVQDRAFAEAEARRLATALAEAERELRVLRPAVTFAAGALSAVAAGVGIYAVVR